MKRVILLASALLCAPLAQGQVTTYCKDIGGGKTYCTGGTVIHRFDQGVVVTNPVPAQPYPPQAMPPNPLLQNNALPTLNAPYTGAGTQQALPAAPPPLVVQPVQPAVPVAPIIVAPPAGSSGRICHQFGTTLVCN